MKILLREHNGDVYAWATAKYNNGKFIVDGREQDYRNVVSVINDNRRKYVQCSSCKKVFRKGDPRFAEHCANSAKPETCFNCPNIRAENRVQLNHKYTIDENGDFVEKADSVVNLVCSKFGIWSYSAIDSSDCLTKCPMRQCGNAKEEEIRDVFTEYPGVFDDLATIDNVLDIGYRDSYTDMPYNAYLMNFEHDTWVYVNQLGIISHFSVYYEGDDYTVYYSKKYDELYTRNRKNGSYSVFVPPYWDSKIVAQMKKDIRRLYK